MNCPICSSEKLEFYASTPQGVRFYLCAKCELLVQENYESLENSPDYGKEKFSSHSDFGFLNRYIGSGKILSRFKRAAYNADFLKKNLENILNDTVSILDIGGGTGENLYHLKHEPSLNVHRAFLVERSDIDRDVAEALYQLDTFNKLDNLQRERFDIITLHHVLEHIPDPKQFLHDLSSLLKPHGYLFLTLPDSFTWLNRWRKSKCAWLIPDHLILYSPAAAQKILREYGFTLTAEKRTFLESPLTFSHAAGLFVRAWKKRKLFPDRLEDGFAQIYQKTDEI